MVLSQRCIGCSDNTITERISILAAVGLVVLPVARTRFLIYPTVRWPILFDFGKVDLHICASLEFVARPPVAFTCGILPD